MRWLIILFFSVSLVASELHLAVKKLDEKQIIELLERGADIDAVDEKGETPLHIAARIGRLSVVKKLLEYDPDLFVENHQGYTPLAIAIHHNHVKSILVLVSEQKGQKQRIKLPKLHEAAAENTPQRVKRFLLEGVPVDSYDSSGRTALQWAARVGSPEIVKVLIAEGADVMHVDNEGRVVMYFARFGKNKAVIDLILEEINKRGTK